MNLDFTLATYKKLLKSFQKQGYHFYTFEDWLKRKEEPKKYLILRHDVDEMPQNALEMAKFENKSGIKSTYFFRIVKQSNRPEIIKKIVDLGHEIGYHYEDFAFANGNDELAIKTFRENLAYFRNFYDVKTVSMHGSSTSKYDNNDLWKKHDLKVEGLLGDTYLSTNFNEIYYITDTGYCWDGSKIAVRDVVKSSFLNTYHHTSDIIKAIETNDFPTKAMMLAHTLWTDNFVKWCFIYLRELVRNNVKQLSKKNKFVQKIYGSLVNRYWRR